MTLKTLLRVGYKACTVSFWPGGTQHFNERVLIITKMVEKSLVEKKVPYMISCALHLTQKNIPDEL